jgi:hypothetical protein
VRTVRRGFRLSHRQGFLDRCQRPPTTRRCSTRKARGRESREVLVGVGNPQDRR